VPAPEKRPRAIDRVRGEGSRASKRFLGVGYEVRSSTCLTVAAYH
jgi:hypothetical protein